MYRNAVNGVFAILFLCISNLSYSQSNFQYGIHVGANYTNIEETGVSNGSPILIPDATMLVSPSIGMGVGYLFNDRFRLKSGAAINWLDSRRGFSQVRLSGLYLEVPLEASQRVYKNLRIMGGISYNHLVNLSTVLSGSAYSANYLIDNKNILAIKTGLSYSIGSLFEIGLSYNQQSTRFMGYDITNIEGETIGKGGARNEYFQLAFYFRK